MTSHAREIEQAERFEFGKNWTAFLRVIDENRVSAAEDSLSSMLEIRSLAGKSFLDVGSGSGLSSLAAARLGAARIHSFDFDPQSVACTRELKRRYSPEQASWTIAEGSVLDTTYLASLGQFDIVYSWGVLHHTGQMWKALDAVGSLVAPGGRLFIAIYNDQGAISRGWRIVKSIYIHGPISRALILAAFVPVFVLRGLASDLLRLRNPMARYRDYWKRRGMSVVRDWVDWLGGYPYEFARPEEILEFYRSKGFNLLKLKTCGRTLGNNEFVFLKPGT